MKPKGIPLIERVADKAFLALFGVIFLAVVAMQFVGGGATVKIANNELPVERAYNQVATLAQSRRAQLESVEVAAQTPAAVPSVADRLAEAIDRPILASRGVPMGLPLAIGEGTEVAGIGDVGRYETPALAAPAAPIARVFAGTLDPFALRDEPVLERALLNGVDQPLDFFAVSVQTEFDAEGYRATLQRDPDGAGEYAPIPQQWWRSRVEILDVQVERREVRADGSRGPASLLPPPPGVESLRGDLTDSLTVGDLNRFVTLAGQPELARQLRQPPFFAMIAGEPWSPPGAGGEAATDPRLDELRQVRARIQERERRLADLERQASAGSAGVVLFAMAQDRSPAQPTDTRDRARSARQQEIDRLKEEINNLQARQAEIVAAMNTAGLDPETGFRTGPDPILFEEPARLRDADRAPVWFHDPFVEPGATYEYRVRLVLANPLKGYAQAIADDLRAAAEASTIATPFSEWSEPVQTPERAYMFIESAQAPTGEAVVGLARPSAVARLYRFHYGHWRSERVRVQVGDSIRASIEIDRAMPIWDTAGSQAVIIGEIAGPIDADPGMYLLDVLVETSPAPLGPGGREQTRTAAIIGHADGGVSVRRPDYDSASGFKHRLDRSVEVGRQATVATPGVRAPMPDRFAPGAVPEPAPQQPPAGTPADDRGGQDDGRRGGG